MKTNKEHRSLRAAATLAALLLGLFTAASQTQFPSPAGTWDCSLSGGRGGVAYLNFYDDNTFDALLVVVPKPRRSSSDSVSNDDRNGGFTDDRNPSFPVTPVSESVMKVYGAEVISGPWSYDSSGRVIGYFVESVSSGTCTTNLTVTSISETNGSVVTVTYYTNVVVDCPGITNAISFAARVVPNSRLTMVAYAPEGRLSIKGVPARQLKDLSGSWNGLKRRGAYQRSYEFLTLAPSMEAAAYPNVYDVSGTGAGYTYSGIAVLSSLGKIAFATQADNDGSLRATVGSFSGRSMYGKMVGWDQPFGTATNFVSFDIKQQAPF